MEAIAEFLAEVLVEIVYPPIRTLYGWLRRHIYRREPDGTQSC